ncbi:hypothetical protein EVAR_103715_1 [Eumeta japonica]|uniref:Uncharacterized protein n=1 Tax=Eumeta variegata TaxID=151549 RepID=A0A4C1ZJA0_EUMVA|nr:hypothetical protein EVAR_103715_1 [Eumeta japonica]
MTQNRKAGVKKGRRVLNLHIDHSRAIGSGSFVLCNASDLSSPRVSILRRCDAFVTKLHSGRVSCVILNVCREERTIGLWGAKITRLPDQPRISRF